MHKDDDHVPPADSERQPYAATGDLSGGDLYLPQLKAATADRGSSCKLSGIKRLFKPDNNPRHKLLQRPRASGRCAPWG